MPTPTAVNNTDDMKQQEDRFFADGTVALNNGDIEKAVTAFKKVLHFNLERHDAHYQLGLIFMNTGEIEVAIDHFQNAVAIAPRHVPSWINLGHARVFGGRFIEALSAARFARSLAPPEAKNEPALIKLLAKTLEPLDEFDVNRHIVEDMTACFTSPHVNKIPLVDIVQKLLMKQNVLKIVLPNVQDGRIKDFETLLEDPAANWPVLNHPLFLSLFMQSTICLEELEDFCTALRAEILEYSAKNIAKSALWENSIIFVSALAHQCWITEYLYPVNEAQSALVSQIEERITQAVNENTPPSPYDICVLACYKPLQDLPIAHALLNDENLNANLLIKEIMRVQIAEPWEELRIKEEELKKATTVEDKTSLKVKGQYESFPYPRWVNTAIERPLSLQRLLAMQFPHIPTEHLPPEDFAPKVMIAGCGTGRQAIENAMLIEQSNNTAIDITANSLAYAIRKYNESGLNNIRFKLADILKLDELDTSFDLVICGGVLHHMRDPMEGWRALYDITKDGGFMSIALYSDIARRNIVTVREYIAEHNINDDVAGIHKMRKIIKNSPDESPMKKLVGHRDFYSVSECRDLLFHVQEHRFTCLQLEESIQELGLEFLGFQNIPPDVKALYLSIFENDANMTDLKNWQQFEEENPDTFRGMYQFWVRKP